MIRSLIARAMLALASLSLAFTPALADIAIKDGSGAAVTLGASACAASVQCYKMVPLNSSFALIDPATSQLQTTGNGYLGTLAGTVGTVAAPASTTQTIAPGTGAKFDTVVQGASSDIGASVAANTSATLAAANAARRGFTLQNQTTGACYLSGLGTATADYHSLLIPAGGGYESKDSHVGTGALSIVCSAAGGVYGRQW